MESEIFIGKDELGVYLGKLKSGHIVQIFRFDFIDLFETKNKIDKYIEENYQENKDA